MAKTPTRKAVETLKHSADKRRNIPTAEFQSVLKPDQPLPLPEHAKVQITVQTSEDAVRRVRETAGIIPCRDPHLIELIACELGVYG